MTNGGSYYNPGETRELFMLLSMMQLGMIGFVVPGLTAGVISGERERQTLNILLTTNVSATRLILGKWLASLSFMTFLVFATIPLYAIVFLYGGFAASTRQGIRLLCGDDVCCGQHRRAHVDAHQAHGNCHGRHLCAGVRNCHRDQCAGGNHSRVYSLSESAEPGRFFAYADLA